MFRPCRQLVERWWGRRVDKTGHVVNLTFVLCDTDGKDNVLCPNIERIRLCRSFSQAGFTSPPLQTNWIL